MSTPRTLHFAGQDDKMDAASIYDSNLGKTQEEINAAGIGALLPTGADQTQAIVEKLTSDGVCQLGKGDFYVSNIVMPADTKLFGAGEATKLHFVDGASGNMVTMGDRCSVDGISFYGADQPIDVTSSILGAPGAPVEDTDSQHNLWKDGDVTVNNAKTQAVVISNTSTGALPAGTYKITATLSRSDSSAEDGVIQLGKTATETMGSASVIATAYFPKNQRATRTITITEPALSMRVVSIKGAATLSSEWTDIVITRISNDKCGLAWIGDSVRYGAVRNCRFYYFDVAGLLMQDTIGLRYPGTESTVKSALDRNLVVSDCHFVGNSIGAYIRKYSEYHLFNNCVFVDNYFGCLNRGGNNYFSNCGFNRNYVGFQVDSDEGENGGHGCVSNCSFNHSEPNNTGIGIVVDREEEELFTNCIIGYSDVLFHRASGCIISSCFVGGSITIKRGNSNMVIGCYFHGSDSTIKAIDNDKTKLVNCYYFVSGGAVPLETETTS